MNYDFSNLFLSWGDDTVIVSGLAEYETRTDKIDGEQQSYAVFVSVKIKDLYRTTESPELQGHTEADLRYFENQAVEELNKDTELCAWLARIK